MSEQVGFVIRADDNETFAPHCLDGSVGGPLTIGTDGRAPAVGTLVSYEVAPDGSSIAVTVEMPDGMLPSPVRAYSVA